MNGLQGYTSITLPTNHKKLKKGMHIANFSVMTPEQMKHVRPVDTVSTWHLLKMKKMLFIILAVFLKPTAIMTNTNNNGCQRPKIQGTKRPTRQYKKEFSENYETCKKQKVSIHRKMKNLDKSSSGWEDSVPQTGRTQCYNNMK